MTDIEQIIDWTEQEIDFESGETVQEAFDSISEIFEGDQRLPLGDILRDQLPEFKQYITDRMAREQLLPKDEPATDEQERRVTELESDIDRLPRPIQEGDTVPTRAGTIEEIFSEFGQIIRGRESVVLPKGFIAVEPDIIQRDEPSGFELNDTLQAIVTFFRGLFK